MEDSTSQSLYYSVYLGWALVSLAVALAAYRRWVTAANGCLQLPPGPWQLPVIGSLHHLIGQLPHRAMRDLARRHGPIMLLRLGELPTLVLSSPDAAREVMKTHDLMFATRPLNATMRVVTCDGRDISFAPYGEYWRQLRKIAVTELLTVRRVHSFRAIREEEVAAMLRDVEAAATAAHPVEMRARLSVLILDTTFRAVMGDRCKQRDLFLELDTFVRLATGFNPVDLWPSSWLARRLSGSLRRAEENHTAVSGIINNIIEEHLERSKGGGAEAEDMLDVLLKIHKDGVIDMLAVQGLIFVRSLHRWKRDVGHDAGMGHGGADQEPRVIKKATTEVRRAFEGCGMVVEDRLGELPYLYLIIRETLRLHPPLPLLLPRECRESCKVLGFDVPKGTRAVVNVWALGRDEQCWPHATEEFCPERFEAAGAIDFRGTDFELLPFGSGRRMCPGIAFGLANVELPLASLLLHLT
ncbi:unnamed protein product [Alopecurus aequalis]